MERVRDLLACGSAVLNAARYGPERSSTTQLMPTSQLRGCSHSHRVGACAVLCGTTSRNWPRPTSTMLVAQALVLNRPRRHIRCSSSPSASVWAMRSMSASNSTSPKRRTDAFQFHLPLPVRPHQSATTVAVRSRCPLADMHPQRLTGFVVDAEHLLAFNGGPSPR